jgi:peptidoglycan/LPS O-acetylase OafA/YrhL
MSGFLITQILLTEERAGRFSIADFNARRLRRIFPALIAVMAVTYAIGWLILVCTDNLNAGVVVMKSAQDGK